LTDGTVLSTAQSSYTWVRLKPDAKGSYANGTWSTVPASSFGRSAAQEYVLKDGRFYIAGGEYLYQWPGCGTNCYATVDCSNQNFSNVELYDPVANKWTLGTKALDIIGDTGSALLSDGRILDSANCGNQIQIYDPSKDTWTASGNELFGGAETSWANLLNGGVLAVGNDSAAVFDPSSNKWTATGKYPSGAAFIGCNVCGPDTSGVATLFDGRVMAFTNPNTMIYTPAATPTGAGTWASGPAMLNQDVAGDEFADTEPNGKILITSNPNGKGPDMIEEYDPATNAFTDTKMPDLGCGCSYMNLPNGQILVTGGSDNYLYTPDSQPNDSWRPAVTSVTYDSSSSTYTLTGTQLSGLVNGGDEGDDQKMTANFPIVWLKDTSGNVYYCRSFNFSVMVPAQGTTAQTCQFTTPAGLANGTYDLYVSSVGVQSKTAVKFTAGQGGTGVTDAGAGDSGSSASSSSSGSASGTNSGTTSGSGSTSGSGASSQGSGSAGSGTSSHASGSTSGSSGASTSGGGTGDSSGCGCVAVGGGSGPAGAGGAAVAALLFLLTRRRRAST
jgi:hypothetical protein